MTTTDLAAVVEDTLAKLREAAESGEPDALARLRGMAQGQGAAPAAARAAAAPPAVKPLRVDTDTVPRPNGELYRVRQIGAHHDVAAMRTFREKGLPPLLTGPPGTGKTALVEASYGELLTVQGTGDTDVSDFEGGWVPQPGGGYRWADGPLVRAMEAGLPLLVDEAALVDPKVMAVVYSAMDGRARMTVSTNPDRAEVVAAPGFFVVATTNPDAPGARMGEALLSRFLVQFQVMTDYALANRMGVEMKVCTAARNLQTKVASGDCGWAPQMRELLAYRDVVKVLGRPFALANLVACAPATDRQQVAEVLAKATGESVRELVLE